jgi:hypothetical protein
MKMGFNQYAESWDLLVFSTFTMGGMADSTIQGLGGRPGRINSDD